jgi:hypothetical protein
MEILSNYLIIDSNDRNKKIHPNPDSYTVQLNDILKNVTYIKLVYAVYNKQGKNMYVNLHIEEFSPNAISNNQYIKDSFTQLPLIDYITEYKNDVYESDKRLLNNPISKLSKLTIKFIDNDGQLYSVGEHMMKFRIEYYNHNEVPEIHLNKRNTQMISHLNKIGLSTQIFTKDDLKEALKKRVKEFSGNEEVMRDLKKAYIFLKERTTHILPNRG